MRFIRIFLLLIIFASVFLLLVFAYLELQLESTGSFDGERKVEIEKGSSAAEIAAMLEKRGIIKSDITFLYYIWRSGGQKNLRAGVYNFNKTFTLREVADKIIIGAAEEEGFLVTIPEGFDNEQIGRRLEQEGLGITKQEFIAAAKGLQGYLFPDTYRFGEDVPVEDVIAKMRDNFERKTGGTTRDIVIMASLLERELREKEDMRLAAGILWKRLAIGMALQVDAAPRTYEYRGLPPEPIANPGLKAINAAKNPLESDYLYYLSAPDGETIFSKTLEEHNRNRARYLD